MSVATGVGNILVVWDFDNSLINENVDFFIPFNLWKGEERELKEYYRAYEERGLTFTQHMSDVLEKLYEQGTTLKDYENQLDIIPVFPQNIACIQRLGELGIEQKVCSDANQYFIETFLDSKELRGYFTEILTHPTEIQDGKVVVTQWTDVHPLTTTHPHRTGDHMCKFEIMQEVISTYEIPPLIIYVGDGSGDFPAVTALGSESHAFVRKGMSLERKCNQYPNDYTCNIHLWENGAELENLFQQLIPNL